MKNLYNEDYYEKGLETGVSCYTNYRWIPELTIPLAARILEYLNIQEFDTILDFGCAKGYLVKALRLLNREAYGYDISKYALSHCPEDIKKYLFTGKINQKYDWIISKDVFEHVSYEELEELLFELKTKCNKMFCVVPLGADGKYEVPAYDLDKTHTIKEPLEWWEEKFDNAGFQVLEAKHRVKYIKENWSKWKKGNGFFVLKSKFD